MNQLHKSVIKWVSRPKMKKRTYYRQTCTFILLSCGGTYPLNSLLNLVVTSFVTSSPMNCALLTSFAKMGPFQNNTFQFYDLKWLNSIVFLRRIYCELWGGAHCTLITLLSRNTNTGLWSMHLQFCLGILSSISLALLVFELCAMMYSTTWWGLNLIERKSSRIAESGLQNLRVCSVIVQSQ